MDLSNLRRRAEESLLPYEKEEALNVAAAIIDFVVAEDGINVEVLRCAMYAQVERARHRLAGLRLITDLITKVRIT